MGKDIGFYIVSRKSVGDLKSENQVSSLAIYNIRSMSRPQNWLKMIQNTMFMAHTDTAILSTKNHISQTASVNAQCARNGGRCPWGRLDNPHDDALTIAILADANVPSLFIAYFKV